MNISTALVPLCIAMFSYRYTHSEITSLAVYRTTAPVPVK